MEAEEGGRELERGEAERSLVHSVAKVRQLKWWYARRWAGEVDTHTQSIRGHATHPSFSGATPIGTRARARCGQSDDRIRVIRKQSSSPTVREAQHRDTFTVLSDCGQIRTPAILILRNRGHHAGFKGLADQPGVDEEDEGDGFVQVKILSANLAIPRVYLTT